MTSRHRYRSSLPHRFERGYGDDGPILCVIGAQDEDWSAFLGPGPTIYPGASVLLSLEQARPAGAEQADEPPDAWIERRASEMLSLIGHAAVQYDLALWPIVVVGRGRSADVAVAAVLRAGSPVTMAVLLRPAGVNRRAIGGDRSLTEVIVTAAATHLAAQDVGDRLRAAKAEVVMIELPGTGSEQDAELQATSQWLSGKFDSPGG